MTHVDLLDYRTETGREGFFATGFAGVRITAPADAVWSLISNWSGQQCLMPNEILGITVTGDGTHPGDTRTLSLKAELAPHPVTERLVFHDAQQRRYAYSILDGGGTPWVRYYGEFEVQANGPNECIVSYICRFIPLSGDHVVSAQTSVDTCEAMFNSIAQLLSE